MSPTTPETPSERVALVVWYLAHGMALSSREVIKLTGLSRYAALDTMCRISRIIPIYQDEAHIWRVCKDTPCGE